MPHDKAIRVTLSIMNVVIFLCSLYVANGIHTEQIASITVQGEAIISLLTALSAALSFMVFLTINIASVLLWVLYFIIRAIYLVWQKHKRNRADSTES